MKTRILMAAIACAVLAAVTVICWPRQREPESQGKKLSEWLLIYRTAHIPTNWGVESARRAGYAVLAVQEIGTNALPFLLGWVQCEVPQWKTFLSSNLPAACQTSPLASWLKGRKEYDRVFNGLTGLEILGTAAAPALPELQRIAKSSANAGLLVDLLLRSGEEGKWAVLELAMNPATPDRQRFLSYLVRAGLVARNDLALFMKGTNPPSFSFIDFNVRFRKATRKRDLVAIRALYQTNGVSESQLKAELDCWRPVFDGRVTVSDSHWGKDLSRAYFEWANQAHAITTHECTHLIFVPWKTADMQGTAMLPLVLAGSQVLIVVSDRRKPYLGPEPRSAPDMLDSWLADTNQDLSPAGFSR